jgi:hypothetical protein
MIRSMGVPFMVRDALRPLDNNFKYRAEIRKPHADLYERGISGHVNDRERFRNAYDAADDIFLDKFVDELNGVSLTHEFEIKDGPRALKILFNEESDLIRFVIKFDCDIEEVLIACNINEYDVFDFDFDFYFLNDQTTYMN